MAEMGSWNGHKFVVSPTLIRSFERLSFTGSSNTDTTTSDGQEFVTRKSGKPLEITLTVSLNASTGSNVRSEALAFVAQARDGHKNYLYVGSQKLVECQLMLTKAAVTETKYAPNGKMIAATVELTRQQASKNDGSMPVVAPPPAAASGGSQKATVKSTTTAKTNTINVAAAVSAVAGAVEAVTAVSTVQKAIATTNAVVAAAKSATVAGGGGGGSAKIALAR